MTQRQAGDQLGRWYIIVAAVMWSTSGFFAKAPIFDDWPLSDRGIRLAFWRTLFAGLVLLPFVRQPQWTWKLIPATLTFAFMNVTYLTAITQTTAANAIWLQNTAPIWVFLFSAFWLREKIVARDWFILSVSMLGVGFILSFELRQTTRLGVWPTGVFMGILAGLGYATVIISLRQLRQLNGTWLIALNHLVTAGLLAPYIVWKSAVPSGQQLMWLAGFGSLQIGIPYVIFSQGLRRITGHEASVLALLEPILVPVWVYLAWHNSPSYQAPAYWTIVGGGLILTGLGLRYLPVSRKSGCACYSPHSGSK